MSELHVGFVRERVKEIRSALFFHEGGTAFIFTATIISALDLDTEGNICFFITRPDYQMVMEDLHFPGRLDFFRKGKPFFLKVSGMASMITDEQENNNYLRRYGISGRKEIVPLLLVKLKVDHVEYYEPHRRFGNWGLMRVLAKLMAWADHHDPDYRISGSLGVG